MTAPRAVLLFHNTYHTNEFLNDVSQVLRQGGSNPQVVSGAQLRLNSRGKSYVYKESSSPREGSEPPRKIFPTMSTGDVYGPGTCLPSYVLAEVSPVSLAPGPVSVAALFTTAPRSLKPGNIVSSNTFLSC